jgi:hypothetical protein
VTRPLAALALASLLVIAGCGGTVPGDGSGADAGDSAQTATLTPAPVPAQTPVTTPTPTPTPMPTALPSTPGGALVVPGLTAGGVSDAFRFADGHREALTRGPYRVSTTITLVTEDGTTLYERNETLHVGADGRYRYITRSASADTYPVSAFAPRIDLWFDGQSATFRAVRPNETIYERDPVASGTGPISDLTGHDRIAGLASTADLSLFGRGVDGDYRVAGQRFASRSVLRTPAFLAAPRNATLSLVVAPSGLVRVHRLSYVATFDGQRVQVVRGRRFERADPVGPPPWLDEALAETTAESTETGSENRRAVQDE